MFLLYSEDGYHPLTEQAALPLRDYQADARLMFEIPGRVRVRAASEAEARASSPTLCATIVNRLKDLRSVSTATRSTVSTFGSRPPWPTAIATARSACVISSSPAR